MVNDKPIDAGLGRIDAVVACFLCLRLIPLFPVRSKYAAALGSIGTLWRAKQWLSGMAGDDPSGFIPQPQHLRPLAAGRLKGWEKCWTNDDADSSGLR